MEKLFEFLMMPSSILLSKDTYSNRGPRASFLFCWLYNGPIHIVDTTGLELKLCG